MSPWEATRVALVGIKANKMRSILTMLGVIIGVGSVITMIALGKGASADITERIQGLGTNLLIVWPGAARQGRMWGGVGSRDSLKLSDAEAIVRKCPNVAATAPRVNGSVQAKWRNRNTQTSVLGTTPEYVDVSNHPTTSGRFFNDGEVRARRPVCVIGTTAQENLFGRNDPVGQKIRLKNITVQVIGVLSSKGGGSSFRDPDDLIVVPISFAMGRIFGKDHLDQIFVMARDTGSLGAATEEINKLMRRRHRIRPGKDDDFNVRAQSEILETFGETAKTFTVLLAGIAALSLLVGGIGVMNIMLVSVTERTREIGIRKAVGARRIDIMMQFVVESLTLCMVGGLIGVALGIGGAAVIAKMGSWRTIVSPGSILLAFGFSAAVGLVFGAYPAHKASCLHPIEALRYE